MTHQRSEMFYNEINHKKTPKIKWNENNCETEHAKETHLRWPRESTVEWDKDGLINLILVLLLIFLSPHKRAKVIEIPSMSLIHTALLFSCLLSL